MIKPLKNRLYVIPVETELASKKSKLYRPDIARRRANQGVVKYRGPDVKEIRVGDYVLFSGYAGTRVALAGEGNLIIVDENGIDAIVDREVAEEYFSKTELKGMLETISSNMAMTGIEGKIIDQFRERFNQLLDDHFLNEGLMF